MGTETFPVPPPHSRPPLPSCRVRAERGSGPTVVGLRRTDPGRASAERERVNIILVSPRDGDGRGAFLRGARQASHRKLPTHSTTGASGASASRLSGELGFVPTHVHGGESLTSLFSENVIASHLPLER